MKIKPIFIGGCDRSGTTMLGSMIGSHNECLTTPESQFLVEVYKSYIESASNSDIFYALDKIKTHWRFYKVWNMNLNYSLLNTSSYSDLIFSIVKQYGIVIKKQKVKFWIDHTPSNIDNATLLSELFPNSKFIHIVRDGRAVTASTMKQDWGRVTIQQNANFWIKKVAFGLCAENLLGCKRVLRVHYEEILLNPEKTLRIICDFIGIDYMEHMIIGKGFILPKYTVSQHKLIGNKPNIKRINAWKNVLSHREIESFEYFAGPILTHFNYVCLFKYPKARRLYEKILDKISIFFIGTILHRLKRSYRKFKSYKRMT